MNTLVLFGFVLFQFSKKHVWTVVYELWPSLFQISWVFWLQSKQKWEMRDQQGEIPASRMSSQEHQFPCSYSLLLFMRNGHHSLPARCVDSLPEEIHAVGHLLFCQKPLVKLKSWRHLIVSPVLALSDWAEPYKSFWFIFRVNVAREGPLNFRISEVASACQTVSLPTPSAGSSN